ncbi:MAG: helix-hairpin-helix domain-containing protein [Planctomycetales bacterium]|nr:helix-hairpin-helix domain-containing protein [Planctomycetales bacterium]
MDQYSAPHQQQGWTTRFYIPASLQPLIARLVAWGVLLASGLYWWKLPAERNGWDQPPRYVVDLDHADWTEFAQLPDVGEGLARRVIESRDREGPFDELTGLERVSGIGPRRQAGMRPFLFPR